jgi:Uncharacterized membrane protein (homolog of Drosophila rhomboid)
MAGFFSELKLHFKQGNALKRFIIANATVFVVVGLFSVVNRLFLGTIDLSFYFSLPSQPIELMYRPWTLISYMFLHTEFFHILFNMLWLYWFGGLFLQLFNEKQLVALYFLGGLAGALMFLVVYNTLPFFANQAGLLQGASASIMAIVIATAFRIPDFSVQLFLIGSVKLKYIAAATILIDLLSMTSANSGGHFAHLGGALLGYFFFLSYKRGHDLTKGFNKVMDVLVSSFKPKPKVRMKVKYHRAETDQEYRNRKSNDNKKLDEVLDKLKKSGYESLTTEEKKFLFDASKK